MKLIVLIACLSVLAACGGGADAPEAIPSVEVSTPEGELSVAEMKLPAMADRMIVDGETLRTLLADVQNAETAETVRPRVEAMIEDYRQMFERMETMDNPSFSDMAALASRAPKLARTQDEIFQQVKRIYTDHPEAADVLRDALDDLGRQPE